MRSVISIRLVGHLRADSPLATSPPRTPTVTRSLDPAAEPPLPLPRVSRNINGVRVLVPYFPASGLRGKLRRSCEEVIRYALAGDGVSPFGLDDYRFLAQGGIKGSDPEEKVDVAGVAAQRAANPQRALFGAAGPWTSGALVVSDAVPANGDTVADVVTGARQDDFLRRPEKLAILTLEQRQLWLERAVASTLGSKEKQRLKAISLKISNPNNLSEQDIMKSEQVEAKRSAATIKKTVPVNLPLSGYEVIPAETHLEHSFVLRFVTEDEAGLFFAGLERFALDPFVGAHVAQGCGQVSGCWRASIRWGQGLSFEDLGTVEMRPFVGLALPSRLDEMKVQFLSSFHTRKAADFYAPRPSTSREKGF